MLRGGVRYRLLYFIIQTNISNVDKPLPFTWNKEYRKPYTINVNVSVLLNKSHKGLGLKL